MLGPYFAQDQCRNQIMVRFRMQFTTNEEADFVVPAGAVLSNNWTSTGLYDVTMAKKYPVFVGGTATIMGPTEANDSKVVIDPADYVASTGVLTYRVMDDDGDGTPALADVPDNEWVYFELCFCDRSTMSPTGALT